MFLRKYLLKTICLLAILFFCFPVHAQLTDLARVEYTYFPQKDSDNSFRRFRAFANVPIQINDDAYIVTGFEYRNVHLKLLDSLPFNTSDNERFQNFVVTLGFTDKLESGWRYAIQGEARLASNFAGDGLNRDDYVFGGSFYFIKDRTGKKGEETPEKPWRLVLGLNYSTTAGRPFPLPFINYYREFAPKWSFGLGVPKSNLKYEFVPNMKLQAFVTLDGFFANLQENEPLVSGGLAENISMTTLLSGLGYEWEFVDHVVFYVYAGHTIINDIRLRDGNGDDVLTLNDTNTFYGRTGIKLKI